VDISGLIRSWIESENGFIGRCICKQDV